MNKTPVSRNSERLSATWRLGHRVVTVLAWVPLLVVLSVMSVLLTRDLGNQSLGYPDAAAQMMDGVFLLDFLRDLPLADIYGYTVGYYAQYPALSIGYRPPFFPLVEALVNAGFGVNMWSSRLAILLFAIVGVSAWYRLVANVFDTATAFWASMLLVTAPFVVQWGWYTMGEIPVLSMSMVAAYVFYKYTETDRPQYLYLTGLFFVFAVWTKQTAIYLALWFILYAYVRGMLSVYLGRRETYWVSGLVVLAVLPLALISLWLGDQNLAQSVGTGSTDAGATRMSLQNTLAHIHYLTENHLTTPVLLLSGVGLIWAALRRDRRIVYFVLLIVCTYGFFWFILNNDDRYAIFWIPSFTVLAALTFHYARAWKLGRILATLLFAAVATYQSALALSQEMKYATGYDEAAGYVLERSASPVVFLDSYNHGYFTYFMRALDEQRSMYVLRGDKLLSSSSILPTNRLELHAESSHDIEDLFDRFGVEYVVVERIDWSRLAIHQELRTYLERGPFELVKEIPVASNRARLKGQTLLIYRYTQVKPLVEQTLELRIPTVGKTIRVPMRAMPNAGGRGVDNARLRSGRGHSQDVSVPAPEIRSRER